MNTITFNQDFILPLLFLILGIVLTFFSWFSTGLEMTWFDLGDIRLVHFTLEHGYQFITGSELHTNFWNPPIFYPATNVSAYTDLMLGFGPFYWIWRAIGIDEWTSWQLWMISIHILNFFVIYKFLKAVTHSGSFSCSVASYCVTFGIMRHIGHPQMIPIFYIFLALLSLLKLTEHSKRNNKKWFWIWSATFFLSCCLQAYGAIYSLVFFSMYLIVAGILIILDKNNRIVLFEIIRSHWKSILTCTICALVLLSPLIYHYGLIWIELGGRKYNPNSAMEFISLLTFPKYHVLYGFTSDWTRHAHGIGIVTLVLVIWGLNKFWKEKGLKLIIIPCVIVVLLGIRVFDFSLWAIPYYLYPLSHSIRAVSRIALILAIPISIGITFGVKYLQMKKLHLLTILLVPFLILEQYYPMGPGMPKKTRSEHVIKLAEQIPSACNAFLLLEEETDYSTITPYGPSVTEDAEWAALLSGVPTINGRYGNFPIGYRQLRKIIDPDNKPYNLEKVRKAVDSWLEFENVQLDSVCIITYPRILL